ncbi:MAG: hypothetical protein K9J06_08860 [Flavobacteriales bacterium]|nr:hypothetical protein [Flavobacteriales bacterium]
MSNFNSRKLILLSATAVIMLSSCATIRRTSYDQAVATTPIVQAPLVADLEIDPSKKVRSQYRAIKMNETQAKQAVLWQAMKDNGCDVIVQPVYELAIGRKVIDASVEGMCGRYKAVRKPTLEDITLLQELDAARPMFDQSITIYERGETRWTRSKGKSLIP